MERRRPSLSSPFRRPKPDGRFKIANTLKEPVRAVAQSFIMWPAAALAAIMYAAPQNGVEKPAIMLVILQITVLYPIIAGVAFGTWFYLARAGKESIALVPLYVPLGIMAIWAVISILFTGRFLASVIADIANLGGAG